MTVKPVFSESVPDNIQTLSRFYTTRVLADDFDRLTETNFYTSEAEMQEAFAASRQQPLEVQPIEAGGHVIGYNATSLPAGESQEETKSILENYNGYKELKDRGWRLQQINDTSKSKTFVNDRTGEAYVAFDQYGIGGFDQKSLLNTQSDEALIFGDVPLNLEGRIKSKPQFSAEARAEVEGEVARLREAGHDVGFTGWSKGGYAATHWGTMMDVPVDTLNAHIMPYNEFPATNAPIRHHTTTNDRTSFKYGKTNSLASEAFRSHEHVVYPGQEGSKSLLEGHDVRQFHGDTPDVESGFAQYEAMKVNNPGAAGEAAGKAVAALGFTDAAFDLAEGNTEQGMKEGGEAAAFLINPGLGQEIAAWNMYDQSKTDYGQGKDWTGRRHVGEAVAMAGAPLGGPLGMLAVDEGVGGVEEAFGASTAYKGGDQTNGTLEAVQATLDLAGAVTTPLTAGAGGLFFGLASGLVHLGERSVDHRRLEHPSKAYMRTAAGRAQYLKYKKEIFDPALKANKAAATYGHVGGHMVQHRGAG